MHLKKTYLGRRVHIIRSASEGGGGEKFSSFPSTPIEVTLVSLMFSGETLSFESPEAIGSFFSSVGRKASANLVLKILINILNMKIM